MNFPANKFRYTVERDSLYTDWKITNQALLEQNKPALGINTQSINSVKIKLLVGLITYDESI